MSIGMEVMTFAVTRAAKASSQMPTVAKSTRERYFSRLLAGSTSMVVAVCLRPNEANM